VAGDTESRLMFGRRAFFLGAVQLVAGGALIGRMAHISIAEADRHATAAEDNRVALQLIPPRRGWIVDAAGAALAVEAALVAGFTLANPRGRELISAGLADLCRSP